MSCYSWFGMYNSVHKMPKRTRLQHFSIYGHSKKHAQVHMVQKKGINFCSTILALYSGKKNLPMSLFFKEQVLCLILPDCSGLLGFL
ncbi:hypothetical protein XENTR_v10006583 [Xenopus tropicalis]|nr:hypothetical protein XENTR_v10006583 [Xenopus tropicalis]